MLSQIIQVYTFFMEAPFQLFPILWTADLSDNMQ